MASPPAVYYADRINVSEDSVLYGYECDNRGQREKRRDLRIFKRNLNPKPWRHFWLPPQPKYFEDPDKVYEYDSDSSEDITPRRKKMICRPPLPEPVRREKPEPDLFALLQLRDEENHDMTLHTCDYCNKFTIDLRKQAATAFHQKEDPPDPVTAFGGDGKQEIGYTVAQALDAAADGCVFFMTLARSLDPQHGDVYLRERAHTRRIRREKIIVGFSLGSPEGTNNHVRFFIYKGNESRLGYFQLFTIPGENPIHPFIGYRLPPNHVPDSELSFSRARSWLRGCWQHHGLCRSFNRWYMPKRLIEILDEPGDLPSSHKVRLATNPPPALYAVLSYCWGGDQPGKTAKKDDLLQKYEQEIPLKVLPRTIRDALVVTRRINLKFLWVDAMCIVQDDKDDVAEQITQMHHIYRGAMVTISVTDAATSSEGFLQPRTNFRPVKLRARLDDNVFGDLFAVPFYTDLRRSRLLTRGWTYQEGCLSTRSLMYTDERVMFRCLEARRSDDNGAEIPIIAEPPSDFHLPRAESPPPMDPDSPSAQTNSLVEPAYHHLWQGRPHPEAWFAAVEKYTERELTVESDKLPAIAAIADEYAATQPVTTYLAGLWKEHLYWQLLWHRTRDYHPATTTRRTKRPTSYRAPSWSWASMEGQVGLSVALGRRSAHSTPTATILDVATTLYDQRNPFGRVTGGFLRMRAKMRRLIWHNTPVLNHCGALSPGDTKDRWTFWGGSLDHRLSVTVDVLDEFPEGEVPLWCIEMYTYTEYGRPQGGGLLLAEVEPPPNTNTATNISSGANRVTGTTSPLPADNTFRRVGDVTFGNDVDNPYWFDDNKFETYEWREIIII